LEWIIMIDDDDDDDDCGRVVLEICVDGCGGDGK
jgi:hypothetical protein